MGATMASSSSTSGLRSSTSKSRPTSPRAAIASSPPPRRPRSFRSAFRNLGDNRHRHDDDDIDIDEYRRKTPSPPPASGRSIGLQGRARGTSAAVVGWGGASSSRTRRSRPRRQHDVAMGCDGTIGAGVSARCRRYTCCRWDARSIGRRRSDPRRRRCRRLCPPGAAIPSRPRPRRRRRRRPRGARSAAVVKTTRRSLAQAYSWIK